MTAAQRDLRCTLIGLLALLVWDLSGADLAVTRLIADSHGFNLRDHWLLSQGLHDGGRWLSWALLAVLAWDTAWPRARPGPALGERALWLGVVPATAALVSGMKRLSQTSCPWDLAEFGGVARHVPHWLLGVADGGPGHCFPSGHAASVLAFIGVYFLWRAEAPQVARRLAAAVWGLGALYGAVQVLRGAHLVSHVLWSAWICWALAAAVAALLPLRSRLPAPAPAG